MDHEHIVFKSLRASEIIETLAVIKGEPYAEAAKEVARILFYLYMCVSQLSDDDQIAIGYLELLWHAIVDHFAALGVEQKDCEAIVKAIEADANEAAFQRNKAAPC